MRPSMRCSAFSRSDRWWDNLPVAGCALSAVTRPSLIWIVRQLHAHEYLPTVQSGCESAPIVIGVGALSMQAVRAICKALPKAGATARLIQCRVSCALHFRGWASVASMAAHRALPDCHDPRSEFDHLAFHAIRALENRCDDMMTWPPDELNSQAPDLQASRLCQRLGSSPTLKVAVSSHKV